MVYAKVVRSGIYSTFQDEGRNGYLHYGVPVSGAMDRYSAAIANLMVGNSTSEAVIEMTAQGICLQFEQRALVAYAGAECRITLDDALRTTNSSIVVNPGQELDIGVFYSGWRGYLAVKGGWQSDIVLGSRSSLSALGLKPLRKNDNIPYFPFEKDTFTQVTFKNTKSYLSEVTLHLSPGPEFHILTESVKDAINGMRFTISGKSNRMAMILEERLPELPIKEIISSAVFPGIIQYYPNGQLGFIMYDGQVTGGYPRVAFINQLDINILAQMRPGEKLNLKILM